MEDLGHLRKTGDRYEFVYPELGLIIRGAFAEWVLEAAADVIADSDRLTENGKLEEMEMLVEFGEADPIDVDGAKFALKARFEAIPQCIVSMGSMDYRWVSQEGRQDGEQSVTRLIDQSLTRNNSFLVNEEGVGDGNGNQGL